MNDIQNREDIVTLIDAFYKKALKDEVIGHFFTKVVQLDLEHHLPKMYDFWESTLFYKGVYKGNPMKVHVDLHTKSPIEPEHFDRWLKLFQTTVDTLFEGTIAELAKTRALSIATMIKIKVNA